MRKLWLLLAVVPVLLAAYAVKRSLLPAPASGGGAASVAPRARSGDAPKSGRKPDPGTASGSTPQESTMAQTLPPNLDPFAALDKQYEAARTAEIARFDEAEADIRASIQPALDAYAAEHRRSIENLDRITLNTDQKVQWNRQFNAQYEKARLDLQRTIQPNLDELAVQREEALAKLESDRAQKRTRLQEIQALAERGLIDAIAAKRRQFEVLGIRLPPSAFQALQDRPAPTDTAATPPKKSTPTVKAIMATGDAQFCALIDEALVSEGDTVQGCRVLKIRMDSVEFEKDGKTWVQKAD